MREHPVENMFRSATEGYVAICAFCCAILALRFPSFFFFDHSIALPFALLFIAFGLFRASQALKIKRFQSRLRLLPVFKLGTTEIPISKKYLFIGKGFEWKATHTQRLHQIKKISNERFTRKSKIYETVRRFCQNHEKTISSKLIDSNFVLNPFRPIPEVGGNPFLHGIGNKDVNIRMLQAHRAKHMLFCGAPGQGKSRVADGFLNQDIRNNEAVILLDPKGDKDLLTGIYNSCAASGRLDDLKIVHLGYPEISAKYNPLKNYDDITELPTRITAAIEAGGDGAQFKDFAWKYTNLVCRALAALNITITYETISLYLTRLDSIIELYADKVMPSKDGGYTVGVTTIKDEHDNRVDKNGNTPPPMERSKAVIKYLKSFILQRMSENNISDIKLLVDLHKAATQDPEYIDKITQCLGPVLSKITDGRAATIFKPSDDDSIDLFEVIKQKKVLYIGLDSLSNAEVANAVGKAILSDLVSIAGRIYKTPEESKDIILNLHVDELSEVVTESFVRILNKARGAGFRVTAYTQTYHDLAVALGSEVMAKQALGNFSTLGMMRVENEETAKILVNTLPEVEVISHTQVSMVADSPHGEGAYFNTNNEDRVQTKSVLKLEVSDICALPIGQAFIKMDGNKLYKVRFPLAKKDGNCPQNIVTLINEVNKIPEIEVHDIQNKKTEISNDSTIVKKSPELEAVSKTIEKVDSEAIAQQDSGVDNDKILVEFKNWLIGRIQTGNKRFHPDGQHMTFADKGRVTTKELLLKDEIFIKYQLRSGIEVSTLKNELEKSENSKCVCYNSGSSKCMLWPITLPISIEVSNFIEMKE